MGFWGWVITVVVVLFASVMIYAAHISKKTLAMTTKLTSLPEFNPDHFLVGADVNSGIAIDELRKKLCLLKYHGNEIATEICSYRDVISSEIFEDGVVITTTSRLSQMGGAIVGGALFGGVGAVLGGLSGKTTSAEKTKRIDLRITVNKMNIPIHDVTLLDVEVSKTNDLYTAAMQKARHWHGIISALIRQAEDAYNEKQKTEIPSAPESMQITVSSVSDEIRKLAQLRDDGLISNDEFDIQKTRVLTSTRPNN